MGGTAWLARKDATMKIFKTFGFEAAHRLPSVPQGHKCAAVHGHSYRVTLTLEGSVDAAAGWVQDFADVKTAFGPLLGQLDHAYLNDVPGLELPTVENIAAWLWGHLKPLLPLLSEVRVDETATSGCIYAGEPL